MTFRKVCAGFLALAAAAACTPEEQQAAQELVYNSLVQDGALSQGYQGRTNFNDVEGAADNIRSSAKFLKQRFVSGRGPHFSLSTANVEYAHAVGLTGAGQKIAIVDSGFLTSHEVFASKSVTIVAGSQNMSNVPASSPNDIDHGTYVASIAAADGNSSSDIVGVAPGASLLLGSFYSHGETRQATLEAISSGAIAQNNSWGFLDFNDPEPDPNKRRAPDGTAANFNAYFMDYQSGRDYIDALKTYSQQGVIVFAVPNLLQDKPRRTTYDLTTALPDLVPGLESGFLVVNNVRPVMNGNQIVGAELISNACLEAARYCLGADGHTYGAKATSNTAYDYGNGSSFAAPQVSGALAVLAEAFPSLTSAELRARLLASANNSFFKHDGYVNFSSTVKHGFNSEFGHGFLDLKAALLPIGSSYMRTASGSSVPVNRPSVISTGAAGNALSRGLRSVDIQFSDGLGAGFDAKASFLAAHAIPKVDPVGFTYDMLDQSYEVAALGDGFGNYLGGERRSLDTGAIEVTYLAPGHGFAGQDVGVDVKFDQGQGVTYSLTAAVEGDTFVGISSTAGKGTGAMHGAAGIGWSGEIAPRLDLALGARIGVAAPLNTGNDLTRFSTAAYDELGMQLVARDVSALGDRLAFRMALPQAVTGGQATFTLPNARGSGAGFRNVGVDLAPTARQLDIGLDYSLPTGNGGAFILSAGHKLNHGHVAGQNSTSVGFGWKIEF